MQTRKYARPLRPYSKDNLIEERKIMDRFGLRRKKELWRAQESVRSVRRRAMQLLASEDPELRKQMIDRLHKLGIVEADAEIDNILGLDVEKFLNRRLQSIVHAKGLANTMRHARQMIVHRLIEVGGRRIQQPSFMVSRDLEDKIKLIKKLKSVKKKEAPKVVKKQDQKPEEKSKTEKSEPFSKEQNQKSNKSGNVDKNKETETKEEKKEEEGEK